MDMWKQDSNPWIMEEVLKEESFTWWRSFQPAAGNWTRNIRCLMKPTPGGASSVAAYIENKGATARTALLPLLCQSQCVATCTREFGVSFAYLFSN